MKPRMKSTSVQAGVSMMEVLVTMVILLVGLLGLAGMMMQSQRAEAESYQRTQALILLQDMVARINTNRKVASCYAVTDGASGEPYLGTGTAVTAPTCAEGTAAQQALAIQDMTEWSNLLQGAAEKSGTNAKVGAMIGARGCVSYDATANRYFVSVAWQGMESTSAPAAGWTCATGQYGDEKLRRVVSVPLSIADLGS